MRLDGDKIVDVSEQDATDLREYLRSCVNGRAGCPSSVCRLYATYMEAAEPGSLAPVDVVARFVAMVGLALADAPKASPAGSEEPFRGILARADETLRGLTPKGFTTAAEIEQATHELIKRAQAEGVPHLIPDLSSYETEEDACASLWSWLTKRQRDCAHNAGDSSNVVLWESRHRITQGHDIDAIRPLVRWIRSWQ